MARWSLRHQGVRQKLFVAFALMSIIPLLVLVYLAATYLIPQAILWWHVPLVIAISAVVATLGFVVARDLVMPVVRVVRQARILASEGQLDHEVTVERADEIGELGVALNRINQRIRDHLGQLRQYGGQVKELNLEIHHRILAFSHLLQVSNLISQGAPLDEVLEYVVEKLSQSDEADLYALLLPAEGRDQLVVRIASGADPQPVARLQGTVVTSAWLSRLLREAQAPVIVDGRHRGLHEHRELQRVFGLTNAVIAPAVARGRCLALVITGNRRSEEAFADQAVEMTRVFAKQIAIAMETDLLAQRAKALTITDELTGLYNDAYLRQRLDEEIRRAAQFHHPCAVLWVELETVHDEVLKRFAQLVLAQVTPADKVARVHEGTFGVILPERTKREAIRVAEAIRQRAEDASDHLAIAVGVSENPLDGATAEELLAKAQAAAQRAKREGKHQVMAS